MLMQVFLQVIDLISSLELGKVSYRKLAGIITARNTQTVRAKTVLQTQQTVLLHASCVWRNPNPSPHPQRKVVLPMPLHVSPSTLCPCRRSSRVRTRHQRRVRKNAFISSLDCCAKIPPRQTGRWFSLSEINTSNTLPAAPAFGS